jgi:antitoxin (DNA-binding transcriptional repressor) of toxin-antitoxin stability system
MKLSPQYALTHFEDVSAAVDRGEVVEIVRPGKPGIHLVASSADDSVATAQWHTPERPRSELFGSLKGMVQLAQDWDSPETGEQIADMFEGVEPASGKPHA